MKSLDFIIKQIGILQDGITTEEFKIEQKSGSKATIVFLQELIKEYEQVKVDLKVLQTLSKYLEAKEFDNIDYIQLRRLDIIDNSSDVVEVRGFLRRIKDEN